MRFGARIGFEFLFVLSFLLVRPVQASTFNETASDSCQIGFRSCLLAPGDFINTSDARYANCSTSLTRCLKANSCSSGTKSEDCYLAEAAWDNAYISIGFSAGVFLSAYFIFPAILKVIAKTITKWNHLDPASHPHLARAGHVLVYMTDENGDGKVTPSEIITPQTLIAFGSVALPIYQWFEATLQQAKCDYQKSL